MFRSNANRLRAWLEAAAEDILGDGPDIETGDTGDIVTGDGLGSETGDTGDIDTGDIETGDIDTGDGPDIETGDRPHPHRRPLRWDRPRRAGTVPARPAHCLSPIRPATERHRDVAAR
jgi:hypothetical protein